MPPSLKPCLDCGTPSTTPRCPSCATPRVRDDERRRRLYDADHRRRRRDLIRLGASACPYCRRPILAGEAVDLDHATNALTHAKCNRRAGGRVGAAITNARRKSEGGT